MNSLIITQLSIAHAGVFNILMFLVLMSIAAVTRSTVPGFNAFDNFNGYLKTWTWPKSLKFNPTREDLFSGQRVQSHKAAGQIKCSASQGISLTPIFALYVQLIVMPMGCQCEVACKVALALCDLIEALLATQARLTTPDQLRSRVRTLLRCCVNAGYEESFVPKFHWLLHLPDHLQRFGMLVTCWVHERKHKAVKRFAADIKNHTVYSKSVLREVLTQQLWSMRQDCAVILSNILVMPTRAPAAARDYIQEALQTDAEVHLSVEAKLGSGATAHSRDVVLIASRDGINFVAGHIERFVSVDAVGDFAMVSSYVLESSDENTGCVIWTIADTAATLVNLSLVLAPCVWSKLSPSRIRILVPYQSRGLKAVAA